MIYKTVTCQLNGLIFLILHIRLYQVFVRHEPTAINWWHLHCWERERKGGQISGYEMGLEEQKSCSEVMVIITIGVLTTISKNFNQWLVKSSHNLNFRTLQKAWILGTARILRQAKGAKGCALWLDAQLNIRLFKISLAVRGQTNQNNKNNNNDNNKLRLVGGIRWSLRRKQGVKLYI